MDDDATLLRSYARNRSEGDFSELVRRHLNLVYSAALRQVHGDVHLAQDVTQQVFADLARKAAQLAQHRVLAGWLFTSTRFVAAKIIRGERRRQRREQEAQLMQELAAADSAPSLDWDRVRPVLDEALSELKARDREAILLRYLEGRNFDEVGARLSLTGNAARMRVDRAVEKLRLLLERRGLTSTGGALAVALASQAVVAAPAGLATTVTGTALAAGSGTVGIFAFVTMIKTQIGIASAVLAVGAGTYVVQNQTLTELRAEWAGLHQSHAGKIEELRQSNRELERTAVQAADLRVTDAELTQLRDEALAVQARLQTATLPSAKSGLPPSTQRVEFKMGQLDQAPKPTKLHQPAYPAEMLRAGISGSVDVSMVIDSTGKVVEAKVAKSSRAEFESAALEAVMQSQFDPGLKGGRSVNTRVTQKIEFKLADSTTEPADWF